jgi:hypothetical protein
MILFITIKVWSTRKPDRQAPSPGSTEVHDDLDYHPDLELGVSPDRLAEIYKTQASPPEIEEAPIGLEPFIKGKEAEARGRTRLA